MSKNTIVESFSNVDDLILDFAYRGNLGNLFDAKSLKLLTDLNEGMLDEKIINLYKAGKLRRVGSRYQFVMDKPLSKSILGRFLDEFTVLSPNDIRLFGITHTEIKMAFDELVEAGLLEENPWQGKSYRLKLA